MFNKRKISMKIIATCMLVICAFFVVAEKDVFLSDYSQTIPNNVNHVEKNNNPSSGEYQLNYISVKGNTRIRSSFIASDDKLNSVSVFFVKDASDSVSGIIVLKVTDSEGNVIGKSEIEAQSVPDYVPAFFSPYHGLSEGMSRSITLLEKYVVAPVGGKKEIKKSVSKRVKATFGFGDNANSQGNWIVSSGNDIKTEDLSLKNGEEYNITIESNEVNTNGRMDLVLFGDETTSNGTTIKNDKSDSEKVLLAILQYHQKRLFPLFFCMLLILISLVIVWLPVSGFQNSIDRWCEKHGNDKLPLQRIPLYLMFILTPFVCFYISYMITGMEIGRVWGKLIGNPAGLWNLFLIILIWWFFYTISNRVKCGVILTTLFAELFAITNYVLILFRDVPLIASDILVARTGFSVMNSYQMQFNEASVLTILIGVVWISLALSMKGWKGLKLRSRVAPFIILVLGFGLFYYSIFKTDVLEKNNIYVNGFKPKLTYTEFGYPLSFVLTIKSSFVERPKGYSAKDLQAVMAEYISDKKPKANVVTEETPNIIAIMNESYSDLSVLGDLQTNEDPMPFYHDLTENTIKGTMHSSVYGFMTANSEFEFLTGFSSAFLPFRMLAYNNMVKDNTPSIIWNLKANGYQGNIAFHPGLESSYNRDNVYSFLGFDQYISLEDLDNPDTIRAFVSDKQDYKTIEEQYESYKSTASKEPFCMFNVTIQNHGGYHPSEGVVDAGIEILGKGNTPQAIQFLNLMKESDDALRDFINYFNQVDEPTVIILFGDHQPSLESPFYEKVIGKPYGERTNEEKELVYQVPFLIWANFDIEEEENVEISANYLAAYMLSKTGGRLTAFQKYLLDLRESIPVLTTNYYFDNSGQLYEMNTDSSKYGDLINQYEYIQYNGLIDRKHRIDNFFRLE